MEDQQTSAYKDQLKETKTRKLQTLTFKHSQQNNSMKSEPPQGFKNLSSHDIDPKLVAVLNKGPSYVNADPKQLTRTCLLSRASLQTTIDKLEEQGISTNAINEFTGGIARIIDNLDDIKGFCSLDVCNLYGSIPLEDLEDGTPGIFTIMRDFFSTHKSVIDLEHLSDDDFVSLLRLCITSDVVLIEGNSYSQKSGLAMDNNLAPTLAIIYMNNLDLEIQSSFNNSVHLKRYIDDMFIAWTNDNLTPDEIVTTANSVNTALKFTVEIPEDNCLPFLDTIVTLHPHNGRFSTELYMKPIHSQYIWKQNPFFHRPFPKITWEKNGKELQDGVDFFEIPSQLEGRLLNITKVVEDMHEDIYICQASNNQTIGTGPQERNINLQVEVAPRWNVEIPKVKKFPIASNANLSCDVYAEPEPQIKWFRDGVELVASSKVRRVNTDLLFSDLTLDEAGIYQCVAENKHGMIVSSTYVEVFAIAPSFQKNGFGPFYLFQESEGRLKCDPEATPRPAIFKWYRDDVDITPGVTYQIESDGTLVISNVQRSRDQGKYLCYAENFLGNDSAESTATVYEQKEVVIHCLLCGIDYADLKCTFQIFLPYQCQLHLVHFVVLTLKPLVSEKTRIILAPKDRNVTEGSRVDLRCQAQVDDRLELYYLWKRDDAFIEYNQRVTWERNALTIADLTVEDAGIYTCLAYTPAPRRSEDSASATIDIAGAPYPPYNLKLSSDCQNRNTTLTWVTGGANQAPITHFLVERKSAYADDFWQVIANVTKHYATSYALVKMAGNADLAFRVRAVNGFGPSRPSKPTSSVCRTDAAAPEKWPDNFWGIPGKAEQLDIGWTAMRMVEWNGPGLFYKLWYGRVGQGNSLEETVLDDPKTERFNVPNAGYYVQWQFQIQAINDIAPGPKSPFVKAFSGQDPPAERPEDVTVGTVTARSVKLSWKLVTVTRGSVDGYRIYYGGQGLVPLKRRRRPIPIYASSTNVTGGSTERYTVTGMTPYIQYIIAITAYNSGGDGPKSAVVIAFTSETETTSLSHPWPSAAKTVS
ncbi:fibronectin type III domain-containing protein-like [Montipora foliosa]|uniref:fibronectin type III domain-containing protein-like n=1 Tax=Montipora foliosa TaxID=591990 RepID=UPI0035F12FA9